MSTVIDRSGADECCFPGPRLRMPAVALALLLFGIAQSSPAAVSPLVPSLERGRALYEAHCQHCHTERIHTRPNKIPLTRNDLRVIVDDFRRVANLGWTPEETEDVVEYLNRTHYHFAPKP